ncbi:MAG: glycosyltransferase family 9 protein [Rubrivivax sp.]|nr:glycosyltransferase family 9 protein [Rubrivivax sp.]
MSAEQHRTREAAAMPQPPRAVEAPGGPRHESPPELASTRPSLPAAGPLVVRLRNWVGDVLLGLPMLQRLADAGFELHLVGKGWARDLLAGHGWPVHPLPATLRERVALFRQLRKDASAAASARGGRPGGMPRGRIDALCLPYSFSSAVEFRLAGLRALGHAHEGRGFLLGRAIARERGQHELAVYWALGDALLGTAAALPERLGLRLAPQHVEAARALRAAHGLARAPIVICPFAGGTFDKLPKTWPEFAEFVREDLQPLARAQQRRIVVCPGPGEVDEARRHFGDAITLEGVGLGTYAALLAEAALMISNDTGPGHLAAAVDTPLLSVLGPTHPGLWRAWGPSVNLLGGAGVWPGRGAVLAATQELLLAGDH